MVMERFGAGAGAAYLYIVLHSSTTLVTPSDESIPPWPRARYMIPLLKVIKCVPAQKRGPILTYRSLFLDRINLYLGKVNTFK